MAEQKISDFERAENFKRATRQFIQAVGVKSANEGDTVSFDIPKARLLAGCLLEVKATLTVTHASSPSYTPHEDAPYSFIKMLEVKANTGFAPCRLSGAPLHYNMMLNSGVVSPASATSGRGAVVQGLTASSGGTANTVRFLIPVEQVMNARDNIGFILTQNDATLVTVSATLGTKSDLCPAASGYTVAISNISVGLYTETFSMPYDAKAHPDLSILKLMQEQTFSMIDGENTLKLPTGQIYTRIGLVLYTSTPARALDSAVTSNIQVIINQSDIPYNIPASVLASRNALMYGGSLPSGVYVFDFKSCCPSMLNIANSRDFIDSENLSEFWLRLTTSGVATAKVFTETATALAGIGA